MALDMDKTTQNETEGEKETLGYECLYCEGLCWNQALVREILPPKDSHRSFGPCGGLGLFIPATPIDVAGGR